MLIRLICVACLSVSLSGCADLFAPPRPDASGRVRISCSAYARNGQFEACDRRASEACDGPALMLDSSYNSNPANATTQDPDWVNVIADYQCTSH